MMTSLSTSSTSNAEYQPFTGDEKQSGWIASELNDALA